MEKTILTLVNDGKKDLIQGTTVIGYCSRGERLGPPPNITRKTGTL